MKLFSPDGLFKGKRTEQKFLNWLNNKKITYLYIQQDKRTFSKILKFKYRTKRPDFLIMLPYIGSILVDVKYKKPNKVFNSFPVDKDELQKYAFFQRYFNIPVWYAISNEKMKYETWYWIPISRILNGLENEDIISIVSPKSKMLFLTVPKKYFNIISKKDSIYDIFKEPFDSNSNYNFSSKKSQKTKDETN